jgi:hypothetical protein
MSLQRFMRAHYAANLAPTPVFVHIRLSTPLLSRGCFRGVTALRRDVIQHAFGRELEGV